MATSLADFAEQINPKTLAEARRADFRQATRVHGSFLATAEKRALIWMAERMPYFMVPRYIRFVESLPKTPTERVQKVKLRDEGITADTFDREAAGIVVKR